jgi:EmrB/QacA subfamily drug resistance transporter
MVPEGNGRNPMSTTEAAATPGTPTTTPAGGTRRPTAVLAVILTSYVMILLDNSIVFTSLARLREDLAFTTASLSWVQDAYALTFGGFLLLGARAGDILGRRRMFVTGLVIFSLASLAIGLAPGGGFLIAARAVQGIGSAIVAPTGLALLTAHFPAGPERTRAVAAYGTTAGIGASVGLVLGGVLTDLLSWRVGFLVNVPVGAVLIIAALRVVGETPRSSGRFDVAGAVTSTLGMAALVFGITRSAEEGWADPLTLVAVVVGVLVLAAFVLVEWRATQPILPLRVLAHRVRSGIFVVRLLFAGAMFGYFFFVSQYMQGELGFSPLLAGLGFLPMTAVQFAFALLVPRLTRRVGNGVLVAAGVAVVLVGMAWLSFATPEQGYWLAVALPMVLLGIGQGLGFAPMTAAGITDVEPRDAGAASGLVNVAHQLGGALGVSVMVAFSVTATATTHAALTAGAAMLALALVAAVAFVARPRTS